MQYIEMHDVLNKLYVSANEMADFLERTSVESDLQYVAGNYLKVGDSYALQAYPIPVILIKKKGNIGFNLDGIFFEFLVKKQTALTLDVERFSALYALEVYGAEDSEAAYYHDGLSNDAFKARIEKSKENGFGISFYLSDLTGDSASLYEAFETCYRMIVQGVK